jgi:hypothetical protein
MRVISIIWQLPPFTKTRLLFWGRVATGDGGSCRRHGVGRRRGAVRCGAVSPVESRARLPAWCRAANRNSEIHKPGSHRSETGNGRRSRRKSDPARAELDHGCLRPVRFRAWVSFEKQSPGECPVDSCPTATVMSRACVRPSHFLDWTRS